MNEISKGQRDACYIISLIICNLKKLLSQKMKVEKWVPEGGRGRGHKRKWGGGGS